ncbi:MAG: hypothetical protein R3C61_03535 [Bacteroidia bacterium]
MRLLYLMGNPRTILFINSDPSADGKARWDRECADMAEALKLAKHRDDFALKTSFATTTRSLQRVLLETEPAIVHIAGKNDGKGILFESPAGEPVAVSPAALAGLMDLFADKIELVVLSGCYDESQASAISSVIPFVIGLDYRLPAAIRIESSIAIYDAMGAGRDIPFAAKLGRNAVAMAGGDHALFHLFENEDETELSKRGSTQSEKTPLNSNFPFGDPFEFVGYDQIYDCDRTLQKYEFEQKFKGRKKLFRFFIIHGEDYQSHNGLFKRLVQDCLSNSSGKIVDKSIIIPKMNTTDTATDFASHLWNIKGCLVQELNLKHLIRQSDDHSQLAFIVENFVKQNVDYVAIEFQIRSPHFKKFTPKVIEWFTTEYCQLKVHIPNAPEFLFFFSIIYEDERKASHEVSLDELRNIVKNINNCIALSELTSVEKSDIHSWIRKYISNNQPVITDKIFKKYFKDDVKFYKMADLEVLFDKMISDKLRKQKNPS